MKRLLTTSIVILYAPIAAAIGAHGSSEKGQVRVAQNLRSMPLAFTENRGQWDERALFRAEAEGAIVWIATDGVYYQFTRRSGSPATVRDPDVLDSQPDTLVTLVLRTTLVGARPHPRAIGDELMEYKCNYFIGDDPPIWRTDVPNYRAITLEEVYPGIDLTYYGRGRRVEYDFRVSAGADYSRIRIAYEGADGLAVADDGALVVTTAWGEIRELAPVVYQEVAGQRRKVSAEYQVRADRSFGFRLGPELDTRLPVVIDPVLVYSARLGGDLNDGGRGIAIDASGAVYVTGETFSTDFPTLNAYQPSRTGYLNAFVTKLNASGSGLVYSTYIGGTVSDAAYAIAVDSSGAAYVAGFTSSGDFPISKAYQDHFAGGVSDAFVVKLSSAGNSLIYSTYLGGSNWDNSDGIAVGADGTAYVTGATTSTDFPTVNAYQGTNHGDYDVFVTRFSRSGSRLYYSTYLGGGGVDDGNGIAVDASGAAYVTGRTLSSDFPLTDAFQESLQGFFLDAFVAKLTGFGDSLLYSTFLGGSADDYGYSIAVDAAGEAYVTGRTRSADFPLLNPYQATHHGEYDAFVSKLAATGLSLVYSTFLGGSADDFGFGIAVEASGAAVVAGRAYSANFPTVNAYQGSFQGGLSDAFVTKLSSSGATMVYSTFLGGAHFDGGYAVAVDSSGAAYVTGYSDSDDFPMLTSCQGNAPHGEADVFVAKLTESIVSDLDGDGVPDAADNCPGKSNPCQEDSDGDGTGNVCCCVNRVGDANHSGEDEPTIGDVSKVIDALFISNNPETIACLAEADVNQSGGPDPLPEDITIGDISILIDYLFITGPSLGLPDCL